jgi:hypothetical protein
MAIVRLVALDPTGVTIEMPSLFGLMPGSVTDQWYVKRIDDKSRNGYEIYGVKGSPTATMTPVLIAKVPYGRHVEVHL